MPVLCILTGISSCGSLSWRRTGLWFLAAFEGFDDTHLTSAIRAWLSEGKWDDHGGWRVFVFDRLCPK